MIFNSIPFVLFFSLFFALYWWVFPKNRKAQNILLLVGSYFFYAWTDWKLLGFIIAVSALNFYLGLKIQQATVDHTKRWLSYIGLAQGIGGLLFCKYYNFFSNSFNELFQALDLQILWPTLSIIAPLGISFFTFRTISYILDVRNGKTKAVDDGVVFFSYVAFFPSLLSGPIDKARTLVPQLEKNRHFEYASAVDGLRQILWGLFKKVVIANNCALITQDVFTHYQELPASSLLIAMLLYPFQIYADFSGYSDMAIGMARLLGFEITKNFDFPYFSQNIAEFWRKWNMSLTSWFTEYVFTPLSIYFRDWDNKGLFLAVLINFTVVGIWHGANWTYILFGFLNGLYFVPLIIKGTINKKKKWHKNGSLTGLEFFNILKTFGLVTVTFVIFKSESVTQAFDFYRCLIDKSLFKVPVLHGISMLFLLGLLSYIAFFMGMEWQAKNKNHALEFLENKMNVWARKTLYLFLAFVIFYFSSMVTNQDFIYIQF
ncbi:MBOAT family O-acyltransferase [Flavobacterium sp.]|uniref:MBOAT family O-acyltransferase n=1 Tax=Flavobacterium sp. TaxID=239 RepID=UPI002FDCF700